MTTRRSMVKFACSTLPTAALLLTTLTTAAPAQSRYDGSWSVTIVTDAGDCDRAYRFGLEIQGGRVFYDGGGAGRVSSNGQVTVSIQQGGGVANGSGRLSGNSGGGRWSGQSSQGR